MARNDRIIQKNRGQKLSNDYYHFYGNVETWFENNDWKSFSVGPKNIHIGKKKQKKHGFSSELNYFSLFQILTVAYRLFAILK